MDRFKRRAIKVAAVYFLFVAGIMVLFKTVFMLSLVPTASMESTIMAGDVVFCTRYGINEGDIKRYDILTFTLSSDPDTSYIKRVIGLPGETIEVRNGQVYADGIKLDDSFVRNPMNRRGDGVYVVPEGCYFFMGDNRNQSKDARYWDEADRYVPAENITGKAKYVVFPFGHIGEVR